MKKFLTDYGLVFILTGSMPGEGLRQRIASEVEMHPEVLWWVPAGLGAVCAVQGWKEVRERNWGKVVVYALGLRMALLEAARWRWEVERRRSGDLKEVMSPEMRLKVMAAVAEYRRERDSGGESV